jgi:hypothetical protein
VSSKVRFSPYGRFVFSNFISKIRIPLTANPYFQILFFIGTIFTLRRNAPAIEKNFSEIQDRKFITTLTANPYLQIFFHNCPSCLNRFLSLEALGTNRKLAINTLGNIREFHRVSILAATLANLSRFIRIDQELILLPQPLCIVTFSIEYCHLH